MDILSFNFQDFLSAFIILFAVIDITGPHPDYYRHEAKGSQHRSWKAAVYSLITFLAFLFMGNIILELFQVDISSFAIAGALVIFVMAIEMLLGIEIFRNDGPEGAASIVPIVFPLIAGAGRSPPCFRCGPCMDWAASWPLWFSTSLSSTSLSATSIFWNGCWARQAYMCCASSSVLSCWPFRCACSCRTWP